MGNKKIVVSQKKIDETLKILEGLSYTEWLKVKLMVDNAFQKKIGELQRDLEFSCDDLCGF